MHTYTETCVDAYIHSVKDIFEHVHRNTVLKSQTLHTARILINHRTNNKLCSINKTEYYTATRAGNYNSTQRGWASQTEGWMEVAEHKRTHGVIAAAVQSLRRVRFFATLWTEERQSSLSFTTSPSLLKLKSTESVMPSNHFILRLPLLLLPSVFPGSLFRVFSSESALCIRWPKCMITFI